MIFIKPRKCGGQSNHPLSTSNRKRAGFAKQSRRHARQKFVALFVSAMGPNIGKLSLSSNFNV